MAERVDGGLRAAGDDGVGIAVANGAERLADGVGAGGAGRHHGQAGALAVVADGDVARARMLAIIIGMKKGETRRGPRCQELFALRS